MNTVKTGRFGEQLAKDFLIRQGYDIVTGHWQKRVGEIDLIAQDTTTQELVFVEVKTRSDTSFGYPEETVNQKKLKKINKTAQWFLLTYEYPQQQTWRVDVVSIIIDRLSRKAQLTHFKNIGF